MAGVDIYSEMLDLIDTKYQADQFIYQINTLISDLYHKNVDVTAKVKELIPSPKDEKILSLINAKVVNLTDYVKIQSVLQEVKDMMLIIPIVDITVPFELKDEDLKRLSGWFKVNCNSKIFPRIIVDKTLIGGAAIGFKGIYKDYSIVKTLEEKFATGELNRTLETLLKKQ